MWRALKSCRTAFDSVCMSHLWIIRSQPLLFNLLAMTCLLSVKTSKFPGDVGSDRTGIISHKSLLAYCTSQGLCIQSHQTGCTSRAKQSVTEAHCGDTQQEMQTEMMARFQDERRRCILSNQDWPSSAQFNQCWLLQGWRIFEMQAVKRRKVPPINTPCPAFVVILFISNVQGWLPNC